MNKRVILGGLSATLLTIAAAAAQQPKVTTETGFVAAVSDTKITLSSVPLGGGPGAGPVQGPGPGGGEGRAVIMQRGPDGQVQRRELTPEEAAKMREQMKNSGAQTRMVVREGGQERELTPEEAEKMREKMKAEGKEPHVIAVPREAAEGSEGAVVQRASAPMKLTDFTVDGKTKKKGDIKVGARVTVTFREEDGKKIATSIAPA